MFNGTLTIPLPGPAATSPLGVEGRAPWSLRMPDFVVGPENRLAATAVGGLLERVDHATSPLVLYGPAGSGKSHLARGLAERWRNTATSVVCLTAAEFSAQQAKAFEPEARDCWRDALASTALFVLEDVDQLAGKRSSQRELRHALDTLAERKTLVVLTADRPPALLSGFSPGLRSRLSEGLVVPIALPGRAARAVLVDRLARLRGLSLSKRAVQALAEEGQGNVAALAELIVQLESAAQTNPLNHRTHRGEQDTAAGSAGAIDADLVRQYLSSRGTKTPPRLRDIAALAARHFGLAVADLKSPVRRQTIVAARGVAIYLARELTELSLDKIGDYFGGRDHTTVLHSYRRTEKLVKQDPATRQAVAELQELLLARSQSSAGARASA